MAFHDELDSASPAHAAYRFVPIIGTDQPTFTTCQLIDRRAEMNRTIDGNDEKGDEPCPGLRPGPKLSPVIARPCTTA